MKKNNPASDYTRQLEMSQLLYYYKKFGLYKINNTIIKSIMHLSGLIMWFYVYKVEVKSQTYGKLCSKYKDINHIIEIFH